MRDFKQALNWHAAGKKVAPGTHSVEFTQAILNELNEAIELLKKQDRNDITQFATRVETDAFLARHTGAPY